MKRDFFYIIALSLLLPAGTRIVQAQEVILEAYMHESEMPRGEQHLYMRVFANGHVEYEDVIIDKVESTKRGQRSKPNFVLCRTTISTSELKGLADFLEGSVVQQMDSFYNFALTIDSYIFLNISISRGDHLQTMEVVNFNPNKNGLVTNDRLQPLLGLMCRIQRLRGNAKLSVVYSENREWCPR